MQSILENKNPFARFTQKQATQPGMTLNQGGDSTPVQPAAPANDFDFSKLIENLYVGLLLVLPVFFLPFTADMLSINKSFLVIIVAFITVILFLLNALKRKQLLSFGLKSYIGMVGLLLAAVFSAVFSINANTSIFGHYGNYSDSLLYIVALVLIGFTASNIKLNLDKLVGAFIVGVTFSTILSLWGFYGLSLPVVGELPRVFSFAGSIYVLFGLQIAAIVGSVFYVISTANSNLKGLSLVSIVINGLYLMLGMNFYAILILLVALVYLYINGQAGFAQNRRLLISGLIVVISLWFVHTYDQTREQMNIVNFVPQPRLALTESWLISAESIRDYPFTGSGIGTFVNVFSLYRPASLNVTELWEARFETPFSDLFLWLATAGLLGVTAYAFFWIYSFRTVFAVSDSSVGGSRNLIIGLVLVAFLSLLLLGNSPIMYVFLFILLGVAIQKGDNNLSSTKASELIAVVFAAVLVLAGYVVFVGGNIYAAQYNFRQSLLSEDVGRGYELQARAVQLNPTESVYIRSYISTSVLIASEVSALPDLSESDTEEVVRILTEAVNNSAYLISIEPLNVSNWILRGDLYSLLMDVSPEAAEVALESYNTAIQLERTNPRLWVSLGAIYYRLEDYGNALTAFTNAIQLKRDYANAYYNLAYVLKDAGFINDAVTQMEIVTRLVPEDTEDYERAMADLEEFRRLAEEMADQQAEHADLQVDTDPESVSRVDALEEPLIPPFEYEGIDTGDIDGALDDAIRGSQGEDEDFEDEFSPSPSDGSEFDETQGERDAPIASPEE